MKQIKLKLLKHLWEYLSYYNKMAPFPVYDTDYVKEVRNTIMEMEKENNIDYDAMPVAACTYCKSLHIKVDDIDNDICMRCGSVNEITMYNNIKHYLETKDDNN